MTHDELLPKLWILPADVTELQHGAKAVQALRAVVELHKPYVPNFVEIDVNENGGGTCFHCSVHIKGNSLAILYPCPTIQAIEKELGK